MKLNRSFYSTSALSAAPNLIGKVLVHRSDFGITSGIIVEAEAYVGSMDAAAHSYPYLRTARTEIQYGFGGFAYVYMIYGLHYCMNIVTGPVGEPEVVLIRALEPLSGIELMKRRRKTSQIRNLCSGPGKLCAAMGITKEHYGEDLCGDRLYLETGPVCDFEIETSKRIGIDYAGRAADYPWRFIMKDNQFVSGRL